MHTHTSMCMCMYLYVVFFIFNFWSIRFILSIFSVILKASINPSIFSYSSSNATWFSFVLLVVWGGFFSLVFRLIFQIGLKWNFTEITYLKSPIGESCLWKDQMSWKLGCGLNLNQKKVWTTGAWPENGSSYCPKRCSTPITVCSSTLQRKCLECIQKVSALKQFYSSWI